MSEAPDKPTILVVEDERTIASIISAMLSAEGYCCDIVATGEEAVDVALKAHPALILMDIKLRGQIDGIAACEQIRACADIPILFISAYRDKKIVDLALQCGPSGYIEKPFKFRQLINEVKKTLKGKKQSLSLG
ncbi:MAG TPA: response regulator [Geobacteraceae bacterium]|jgi:DNA-binding response OmpR family regulator